MFHPSARARYVFKHPASFTWHVLQSFRKNKGLLLSGAVAYNTLLSVISILALTVVALSQWFDAALVLETVQDYLEVVVPLQAGMIVSQLERFLANWQVIGMVGIATLILFSAFAFSALENALSIIFSGHFAESMRKVWISLLLPYAFVLMLSVAILMLTLLTLWLDTMASMGKTKWLPDGHLIAPWVGLIGEAILFSAIYYVLPHAPVRLKHAFIGGVTAAILWDLMRRFLVWYFVNLSYINSIFGTFATVMVVLLSLEIAAIILLIGAQVIKEYGSLDVEDNTSE